jgi:hypothetical protein
LNGEVNEVTLWNGKDEKMKSKTFASGTCL